jgi:hypothetical protein
VVHWGLQVLQCQHAIDAAAAFQRAAVQMCSANKLAGRQMESQAD